MEIAMPTRIEINNFNSIKVQLELASRLSLNSISLFQFHKGTIRTYRSKRYCYAMYISIP